MKTLTCLSLVLLAAVAPLLHAGESKRTAEYLLTTPTDFEGKEVALDVAFVKPVHWKTRNPELAFFHALTLDRRDYKPGGEILVAIPSSEAAKFAKKYGTDFEGRADSHPFSGILVAAPGGKMHQRIWLVDGTGKIADLVKQKKLVIEEDGPGGPGPHRPPGPFGPRKPALN